METKITATELAKRLSDVLNRVHYRGERFLIERNGVLVASLVPSAPLPKGITPQELKDRLGNLKLPEGFGDDLEAIQKSQPKIGAPPWRN